jgi:hypothetical protein
MEMLQLARGLDFKKIYRPRIYVIADNDHLSREKVFEFENSNLENLVVEENQVIHM